MIRAVELALLMAPLALYAMWRSGVIGRVAPARSTLILLLVALVVLGGALAWTGLHERHDETTHYVPAELRNGEIVPGHGT